MQAGLYIHIPFCKKKCNYCDFYSVAATNRIDEFIAALKREMDLYRDWLPGGTGSPDSPDRSDSPDDVDGSNSPDSHDRSNRPDNADRSDNPETSEGGPGSYDTLFLGGGTPSLLSIRQLAEIVAKVREVFPFTQPVEWTIEANPDDLTLPYLQDLRSLGFNRLSLGIQSLRDENLTWLGRRHTAAQGLRAIEDARLAGFDNLSIDLIYGLPACLPGSPLNPQSAVNQSTLDRSLLDQNPSNQSPLDQNPLSQSPLDQNSLNQRPVNQWLQELEQVLAYKPEHLSCYQLSYEPHTRVTVAAKQGPDPALG